MWYQSHLEEGVHNFFQRISNFFFIRRRVTDLEMQVNELEQRLDDLSYDLRAALDKLNRR